MIKVMHSEHEQLIHIEVAPGIEVTMYRENAHILFRELKYVLEAIDELPTSETWEREKGK